MMLAWPVGQGHCRCGVLGEERHEQLDLLADLLEERGEAAIADRSGLPLDLGGEG